MKEFSPEQHRDDEKEIRRKEIVALAMELVEKQETFSFSGIDPEAYLKMKATDEEYPGFTTPIDKLIERFKQEGMKVVLGKYPESGNVFILPAGSNDIENDSISPHQLDIGGITDDGLKRLISIT